MIALTFMLGVAAAVTTEQVHLGLTGDLTSLSVDWVTKDDAPAIVQYGTDAKNLNMVVRGESSYFSEIGHLHWAEMVNLTSGVQYFYSLSGESSVKNFTALDVTSKQPRFVVLADHGFEDGKYSTEKLIDMASKDEFDLVLHAGDAAYDMDASSSATGNSYMNMIQPVAESHPWNLVPGNHEQADNFSQVHMRFNGSAHTVGRRSGTHSALYYSMDVGLVHVLGFSTEVFEYFTNPGQQETMINFIKKDLAAVDRSKTPFVVAYAHKWFGMPTNWALLEPLVIPHVDVYAYGHVHASQAPVPGLYEQKKYYPSCVSSDNLTYTDCPVGIEFMIGGTGNHEGNSCEDLHGNSMYCSTNYGFGSFQALNSTHLSFDLIDAACYPSGGSNCKLNKREMLIIKSATTTTTTKKN